MMEVICIVHKYKQLAYIGCEFSCMQSVILALSAILHYNVTCQTLFFVQIISNLTKFFDCRYQFQSSNSFGSFRLENGSGGSYASRSVKWSHSGKLTKIISIVLFYELKIVW